MAVFNTLDNIVRDHLAEKGRSLHYYYKTAQLATNAINEYGLAHVQQTIVKRAVDAAGVPLDYFPLPADCKAIVLMGARHGEFFEPVHMMEELMGYTPAFSPWSPVFGGPFQVGTLNRWANATPAVNGTWNELRVAGDLQQTARVGVKVNMAQGHVIVPHDMGSNELYLIYEGYSKIDNLTAVPVEARPVISAYINWKWAALRRNGAASAEAQAHKGEFEAALKKYKRDKQSDLTRDRIMRATGLG